MINLGLYEKSLEVRLRKINGRTLLINSENGKCFEIDEIGKILWKGIGKEIDVVSHLKQKGITVPTDINIVENDVKEFVNFLKEENLINES